MSRTRSHKSNPTPTQDIFTEDNLNGILADAVDDDEGSGKITSETANAMRAHIEEMKKIAAKDKSAGKNR